LGFAIPHCWFSWVTDAWWLTKLSLSPSLKEWQPQKKSTKDQTIGRVDNNTLCPWLYAMWLWLSSWIVVSVVYVYMSKFLSLSLSLYCSSSVLETATACLDTYNELWITRLMFSPHPTMFFFVPVVCFSLLNFCSYRLVTVEA
jgi:hypothetical protein